MVSRSTSLLVKNGQIIISEFRDGSVMLHLVTPETTTSLWVTESDLKDLKTVIGNYLQKE